MPPAARHKLSERELHEYVADVEGHDDQLTGVVGFFNRRVRNHVLRRIGDVNGRDLLEIGCGEGQMFAGTSIVPVQMDVSMTRLHRAGAASRWRVCADGYALPFRSESFRMVL